jgi:biopolymer transport protein ExbB
MKQSIFMTVLIIIAFSIAFVIYGLFLPDYIKKGGPLVVLLIMMSLMVVTYIFERIFALRSARGKSSLISFLRDMNKYINNEQIDEALAACDKQRGSCANVLRSGLEKYKTLKASGRTLEQRQTMEEIQRSIDEAMMLEVPLLEKNLVVLSTIASIATLTGLLGTTVGMIRAFKALAQSGAPDAIQLSLGISEALINTAGGLLCAIMGIVAYNYFATRIDNFTYMIDEASYAMIQTLGLMKR